MPATFLPLPVPPLPALPSHRLLCDPELMSEPQLRHLDARHGSQLRSRAEYERAKVACWSAMGAIAFPLQGEGPQPRGAVLGERRAPLAAGELVKTHGAVAVGLVERMGVFDADDSTARVGSWL